MADGQAQRLRAIEGQKTLLGRTMHAMAYDEVRDEIIVPQQFGQAILVFRGSARAAKQPPVRVISGPKTKLMAPDRLAVDAVQRRDLRARRREGAAFFHVWQAATFAPIRVITGPNTGIGAMRAVVVDSAAQPDHRGNAGLG